MSDMPRAGAPDDPKAAVGRAAAALVESGMRVGLGTGSTAVHVVRAVAAAVRGGALRDLALVPTSSQIQAVCWELGLDLLTLNDPAVGAALDLAIDGADEVDPAWNLTKGGGGALLNEKVVAQASSRYVIVVDESKLVARLGERIPLPVEVVPFALAPVRAALERRGYRPAVRMAERKQGTGGHRQRQPADRRLAAGGSRPGARRARSGGDPRRGGKWPVHRLRDRSDRRWR